MEAYRAALKSFPPSFDPRRTMKRGFLNKAEEKQTKSKVSASSTLAAQFRPAPQNPKGFSTFSGDNQYHFSFHGNPNKEEKALPSEYVTNVSKESDSGFHDFSDNTTVMSIPQHVPDGETQCEWIVNGSTKEKVLNAPGYPACIPKSSYPDLYEVKLTPDMGHGLFAKVNIKRGDLILAERPLLVGPHRVTWQWKGRIPDQSNQHTEQQITQVVMTEFECLLDSAIARLSSQSQASFKALKNAHTGVLGALATNGYDIELFDDSDKSEASGYWAVCKIGSLINHNCKPNIRCSFKLNSFSLQFYALRDIKAGEQLFFSYCSDGVLAQRQAELAPYGFVCKCTTCLNATPEIDELRRTFRIQIALYTNMVESSSQLPKFLLEDALSLEKGMVKEGLDRDSCFGKLLAAISLAYAKLGRRKECEKYRSLREAFKRSLKDVE